MNVIFLVVLFGLLKFAVGSEECECEPTVSSYLKTGVIVGGTAVVGGVATVVAAPFIVSAIGFGTGGIVAGSWAASMMSAMGPVGAGGVVATLQSVGAAGLGVAGSSVLSISGAGVGTGVGAVVNRMC